MYDPRITHALYKGDKFIAVGSLNDLADLLGVKYESVIYMMSPSHRKRCKRGNAMIVIKLED